MDLLVRLSTLFGVSLDLLVLGKEHPVSTDTEYRDLLRISSHDAGHLLHLLIQLVKPRNIPKNGYHPKEH